MAALSCHCFAKAFTSVTASLPDHNINGTNNKNSNSPSSNPQSRSSSSSDPIITVPLTKLKTQKTDQLRNIATTTPMVQKKLQQQLTFIQLERSIGAGSYRDSESTRDVEKNESILQGLIPDSEEYKETSVEKKLRETGEWVAATTEREFQSSGKMLLMFVFQWVLPLYIFMFLIATGVVKLPFSSAVLDDLIM